MNVKHAWRVFATLLLAAALPAAAQISQPTEVSALAMSHGDFQLTPSTPHLSKQVVIDAAPFVTVSVTSPSKTLSVSLTAPNGITYHIGDPDVTGFESSITPDPTSPASRGANYLANLFSPVAGAWTLDITETASITAPVPGIWMALFDNDVRAAMLGGGQTYLAGETARLSLVVLDGATKVRPLTINATEIRADGPVGVPSAVSFHDDGMAGDAAAGDGVYTASVAASTAGSFQVGAVINGTASTGAFQRTVATTMRVAPRLASLSGLFTDSAIDTTGDGLADAVSIAPGGTVTQSGDFLTTVRLRASNGNVMQRSITANLPAGAAISRVTFPGKDMEAELGVDGPYSVDFVSVEAITAGDLVLADRRVSLGNTAAYHLADFHHEPLRLSGVNDATGIDYNGNGRFDALRVTVGIYAQYAGYYTYSATLRDNTGHELGFVSSFAYLAAGNGSVVFNFSGWTIGQNGVDGPYALNGFLMYGAGTSLVADHVFDTPAFRASQFEGFVGDTTPPTLAVSVTPSILTPPNHKMVEITPSITVSDDKDPNPVVTLLSITSNEGQNVRGDGNTDIDITIDASGKIFLRAERSGLGTDRIYTLKWSARDASGNQSTAEATVTVPHDESVK